MVNGSKGYKVNECNEFDRAKRKTATRLAQLQRALSRKLKEKGLAYGDDDKTVFNPRVHK